MEDSTSELYQSSIRAVIVLFGSLFSNMSVRVYNNDGKPFGTKKVPLAYSAKQQYAEWMDQKMRLPSGTIEVGRFLPRLSFELTGMELNSESTTNSNLTYISSSCPQLGVNKISAPVAYTFSFSLSVWTKNMDDVLQIAEKIMTVFNPDMSVKTIESEYLNITNDVKVVLSGVIMNDNYEEGYETNRMIEWSFDFLVYANVVAQEGYTTIINKAIIDIQSNSDVLMSRYVLEGQDPYYMNKDLMFETTYNSESEIPEEDMI